jgi:unsaturated rhamnogalacturonyl hydrolase
MKKTIVLFFVLLGLGACSAKQATNAEAASAEETPLYSQWMVESQGLQWVTEHDWDYVPGLVAKAVIKTWAQYPEKTGYFNAVRDYADRAISEDGTVKVGESNIDDLAAGKILFELYRQTRQAGDTVSANKYKFTADYLRNKLKYDHARIAAPLPGDSGFWHKKIYPNQMWLDGLYMGPALYAEWQANFAPDDMESWSDIARQFKIIHKYTWNPETKLNFHGWSANPADPNSFWAKQNEPFKGTSKEVWGRGVGWYLPHWLMCWN